MSERHLIQVAQQLELGHYLRLGRGEEKSGGRGKTALLVDALEAILAAIYLDGGLEVAREFVLRNVIAPELERMEQRRRNAPHHRTSNPPCKRRCRAWAFPQPAYVLVEEAGPEHNKTFTVEARYTAKTKTGFCGTREWIDQEDGGARCSTTGVDVPGIEPKSGRRKSSGPRTAHIR